MPAASFFRKLRKVCSRKKPRYWIFGFAFAVLGWYVSHKLDSLPAWLSLKYDTYVLMQNLRRGPKRVPQTTLVAIGDREYYGEDLAARKPLKRDYLAKLVTRLAGLKPRVLALDVDFRSPVPESPAPDFPDYTNEDRLLAEALCAAQAQTKIVVSKAVYADAQHDPIADRNIYDGNAACPIPGGQIFAGYLALPNDLRRIPLSVKTERSLVDSFALAIARADRPRQYPNSLDVEEIPYGRFRPDDDFYQIEAWEVFEGRGKDRIENQIVIIYGNWHVLASGRGLSVVDTFRTPVGITGGAFVHANLVETLLAAEYNEPLPESVTVGLEALLAATLAIAFAFPIGLGRKFVYLAAIAATIFIAAWLFFQVFAVVFDILPILAAMYLHAVADQVEEWREAAHTHHPGG